MVVVILFVVVAGNGVMLSRLKIIYYFCFNLFQQVNQQKKNLQALLKRRLLTAMKG